jgi:hypothetical protein
MPLTNWTKWARDKLNDGQYNTPYSSKPFPGYLVSDQHPFGEINSLTHCNEDGSISVNFSLGDSPELLKKTLETAPPDWHYRNKKVVYTVNKSGYRTREWGNIDWKNSIVLFGCSNTFGTGLSDDETISYYLEELAGRPVVNLGYPSGSNELILNNCAIMLEKFGAPYAVTINWSCIDRLRYYNEQGPIDLGLWNSNFVENDSTPDTIVEYWKYSVMDETNLLTKNYYISKVAKMLFLGRSKYSTVSSFELSAHYMRADTFVEINKKNKARDMIHPGAEDSLKIAQFFYDRIK